MELTQLVLLRRGTAPDDNPHADSNASYSDSKVRIHGWCSVKKKPIDRRGEKLFFSDMRVYTSGMELLYLRECVIVEFAHDPEVVAHLESLIPLEIIARG